MKKNNCVHKKQGSMVNGPQGSVNVSSTTSWYVHDITHALHDIHAAESSVTDPLPICYCMECFLKCVDRLRSRKFDLPPSGALNNEIGNPTNVLPVCVH